MTKAIILTDEYLKLTELFEGVYIDPAGYLTVGIGHLVLPNEISLYLGPELTVAQACKLWKLDKVQFYASVPKFTLDYVQTPNAMTWKIQ